MSVSGGECGSCVATAQAVKMAYPEKSISQLEGGAVDFGDRGGAESKLPPGVGRCASFHRSKACARRCRTAAGE